MKIPLVFIRIKYSLFKCFHGKNIKSIFHFPFSFSFYNGLTARRQEIIKMTEQLIEAINNGDFDAYT